MRAVCGCYAYSPRQCMSVYILLAMVAHNVHVCVCVSESSSAEVEHLFGHLLCIRILRMNETIHASDVVCVCVQRSRRSVQ